MGVSTLGTHPGHCHQQVMSISTASVSRMAPSPTDDIPAGWWAAEPLGTPQETQAPFAGVGGRFIRRTRSPVQLDFGYRLCLFTSTPRLATRLKLLHLLLPSAPWGSQPVPHSWGN